MLINSASMAGNISETTAIIDHQREHFASLSKSMYAVLKVFKTNDITVILAVLPHEKGILVK